ncbi:conserved hypothetical protein [Histoplasma capsulatum var. duboisii H88]|nr:conserved hypothetical protein [Histoplasma capsulatum var. duboisii H88]
MPHSTDAFNDQPSRLHAWHSVRVHLGRVSHMWQLLPFWIPLARRIGEGRQGLFNGERIVLVGALFTVTRSCAPFVLSQGWCSSIHPFRLFDGRRWRCDALLARIWSERPGESTRGRGVMSETGTVILLFQPLKVLAATDGA